MIEVTTEDLKQKTGDLLRRVLSGEEVVIAEGGRKVARLVPYGEELPPRVPDRLAGQIRIAPDFDELPEDFLAAFER